MTPLTGHLARLAAHQEHVLTTAQCVQHGLTRPRVERLVRSGRWQTLHRGVHVVHSGEPSWRTRASAALRHAGAGAALSHESAAVIHRFVTVEPRQIAVVVPWRRHPAPAEGVRIRRRRHPVTVATADLRCTVRAVTLLDLVADARSADDVLGWLTRAVRAGTHPRDVRRALADRPRQRHRRLLLDVLGQVDDGAESPLEGRYHRDVERRHRLPRSTRQGWERLGGGWVRSDCRYVGRGVRVELDGQTGHPGGRTAADTWRDNAALLAHGEITLRYRWAHVALDPCGVAAQVATALRSRGWTGTPARCGPSCPAR